MSSLLHSHTELNSDASIDGQSHVAGFLRTVTGSCLSGIASFCHKSIGVSRNKLRQSDDFHCGDIVMKVGSIQQSKERNYQYFASEQNRTRLTDSFKLCFYGFAVQRCSQPEDLMMHNHIQELGHDCQTFCGCSGRGNSRLCSDVESLFW